MMPWPCVKVSSEMAVAYDRQRSDKEPADFLFAPLGACTLGAHDDVL